MCGIAGIVGAEKQWAADAAEVRRMCDVIVHRGPDDEGIYAKGPVGLGMRRLSIIDLVSGQQPIHNEDRTVWVVFNGEIYNFPELRCELESRGHRFYTNSDTEVIVHLYEDLGSDCIVKLRGMFGIALYDERQGRLLLARDRLGKKPLHYALLGDRLYFGSEIKSILTAAPELAEVNREALLHYFQFGYIPDPLTSFTRIAKLPPGHLLEFAGGRVSIQRYWDLPEYGTAKFHSEEECLEALESVLAEAVRIRLISDVPLGALLSGGVDSSTVVALMARASAGPVKTFSIGFRNQDFNEAGHARLVAQRFRTEHYELIAEPRFWETLEKLTRMLEEPFADSSILPTYHVSCLARQHVTVALSGDGGDELFAGYDRYRVNMRRRIFDHIPAPVGRWYRKSVYPRLPASFRARKFVSNVTLPTRERYLDGVSFLPVNGVRDGVFASDFVAWAKEQPSPLDMFRNYFDHAPARDFLSRFLYLDTKTYLTADIMTKVDRMSMATSLETRAPLLDHIFVERVAQLPAKWKLHFGQPKYLLKKLAERVGVPREVLYRPKQGFAIPLVHWIRKELKSDFLEILLEPKTLNRGYFDRRGVRALVEEHANGRDRSGAIWMLLMFELWHRNYLEALPRRAHPEVPDFAGR